MQTEPVSIIVPAYEEAQNLPHLAERVFAALQQAGMTGELIIVDDDSPDETAAVVTQLQKMHPVRLIIRRGERGLSSAVLRGFSEARYDILMCMDADLSHPPEVIPQLCQPIVKGEADFTLGSRYIPGGGTTEDWSFLRKVNSWGATLLARPLIRVNDPMSGFFCIRRETLQRAENAGLNPIGYKIALEIMIKARCQHIQEVPILFAERQRGTSKLTLRQQLLYLRHLVSLYRFRWPIGTSLIPIVVLILLVAALVLKWKS